MVIKIARQFALGVLMIVVPAMHQGVFAGSAILNGTKIAAGTNKYNYVVELTGTMNCTGIAVGNRWVLTAAHCAPVTSALPFGANDATYIQARFCYPHYVSSSTSVLRNVKNDLALLKTTEPLGGSWQRCDIATPNPTNLLVFGWGKTSSLSPGSTSLFKSKPMLRQDTDNSGVQACNDFWTLQHQVVDKNEICAGDSASSACNGDSGGPLFNAALVGLEFEPQQLVGILSQADNDCDAAGTFDIYTSIDRNWVEDIIGGDDTVRGQSVCPAP